MKRLFLQEMGKRALTYLNNTLAGETTEFDDN